MGDNRAPMIRRSALNRHRRAAGRWRPAGSGWWSLLPAVLLFSFPLFALVTCARTTEQTASRAPVTEERVGGPGAVPPIAPLPKGEGARRMAARLDDILRDLDPTRNIFLNTARAERLQSDITSVADPGEKIRGMTYLADELLKAGRVEEAIRIVEPLADPGPDLAPHAPPQVQSREFLGLCYLRLGEQQNCIVAHTLESCLVPIRGKGVHLRQEGSRRAIREFTRVLQEAPDDLGSRWLLNLAYMTVGEYPGKVPNAWLIPPGTFESEHDAGRFRDVAEESGLTLVGHAGGAIAEDFDGDGLIDLVVSSMGVRDQLRFFINAGDGTFIERTREAGLLGEVGGLNIIHADYNNDGHPDVFVLRGGWMQKGGRFPNSLLRNNGDGTFDDVTEEAGLLTFRPTQTGAWGDYDGDGWLDLMVGNESMADDPHASELWRNNGDGTFSDAASLLGDTNFGYVKGVVWGDYNDDGRPDLFVSVLDAHENRLYRNEGPRDPRRPDGRDWVFTEVAKAAGVAGPVHSFPAWFWDYDNDGRLDLMAVGFQYYDMTDIVALHLGRPARTEVPHLFRNNGDGTFEDVTRAMRLDRVPLAMGSNFEDFDGDGWLDCYFGTGEPGFRSLIPNRMFRNNEGKHFQDITSAAGVGHIQKGHGVAPADFDNDGDIDIFEEMGGWYENDIAHSVLYRNPGHDHRWVTLRVEGRRSNRSALGTRIEVRVRTAAGPRTIHREITSGGSFGGASLQQEIGLGKALAIESITLRWPATGATQVFRDVAFDRVYRIVEGEPAITPIEMKRLPL